MSASHLFSSDVLQVIFSELVLKDRLACTVVCRQWNRVMRERGLIAKGIAFRFGSGFAPWRRLWIGLKQPDCCPLIDVRAASRAPPIAGDEEEVGRVNQERFGRRIRAVERLILSWGKGVFDKQKLELAVKGLGTVYLSQYCMGSFGDYHVGPGLSCCHHDFSFF